MIKSNPPSTEKREVPGGGEGGGGVMVGWGAVGRGWGITIAYRHSVSECVITYTYIVHTFLCVCVGV